MYKIRIVKALIVVWLVMGVVGTAFVYFPFDGPLAFLEPGTVKILDEAAWHTFAVMNHYFYGFSLGTLLLLFAVLRRLKRMQNVLFAWAFINIVAGLSKAFAAGADAVSSLSMLIELAMEIVLPAVMAWLVWSAPGEPAETGDAAGQTQTS
ncbi:MAG: hypothetical protein F4229_01395 [Gammaproteobacteria bacterium]|nr:hypothetical protein [Gammaproteobacteria bacterium]MYH16787.1 hypothetical protein [Gammaproteobacteria bacterium]MYK81718.1 hypothetical protein [Gammaproteobacteria bacterium]